MDRVEPESIGLGCPGFAGELIGGQALQGLQPAGEVVGCDEGGQVPFELLVVVVMVSLDGCVLDGAVHSLDLTVGPRVVDFGEAVLDPVFVAAHGEHVGHVSRCRSVIGQDRVNFVGDGSNQGDQEGGGGDPVGLFHELHEGKF